MDFIYPVCFEKSNLFGEDIYMETLIDFIIDFFITLFIENSDEIVKSKKVSRWIRYPLIILISLFAIIIVGLLLAIGIELLRNPNLYSKLGGLLFIIIDVFLIISCSRDIKRKIRLRRNKL